MVEKSIFLDRMHSPLIELTKREIRIILFWLGLQANKQWRQGGNDFQNIDIIYNELNKLIRDKQKPLRWKWIEESEAKKQ